MSRCHPGPRLKPYFPLTLPSSRRKPGPIHPRDGFVGKHSYVDDDGSRPSPIGAKLSVPPSPRFPFSHALAWEKGKENERGELKLAPMGIRRDDGSDHE